MIAIIILKILAPLLSHLPWLKSHSNFNVFSQLQCTKTYAVMWNDVFSSVILQFGFTVPYVLRMALLFCTTSTHSGLSNK